MLVTHTHTHTHTCTHTHTRTRTHTHTHTQFSIYDLIEPVEKAKPGEMNNMDMGRAITSIITKGVARSQVILVTKETLEKIVQDGKYN